MISIVSVDFGSTHILTIEFSSCLGDNEISLERVMYYSTQYTWEFPGLGRMGTSYRNWRVFVELLLNLRLNLSSMTTLD
jgi:hypothetical protein